MPLLVCLFVHVLLSGYYLLFVLVYWTAAGYGYLISFLFPPSFSQLFAALSVLYNMMFSGILPRFKQLKKIVGGVLYYPTFTSYIRWSQEAFYLHEIEQYKDIYDGKSGGDTSGRCVRWWRVTAGKA